MKLSPELTKALENMKPGILSIEGFLGDETLNLAEVINRDEGEMLKLNLNFDLVSRKLTYFMKKAEEALGEPITVDEKWLVQVSEVKGDITCPFEDGVYPKTGVTLINKENDEKLVYTALSIHLMKKHHFLEGKGSFFRLEPTQIQKVLFSC